MTEDKVVGALVGCIAGDALCMPVHWYYDVAKLKKDYGSTVDSMVKPLATHPESMVQGMSYSGSIDIMHDKLQYYAGHTRKSEMTEEEIKAKSDDHGNFVGATEDERVHYHATLLAGQNTANVTIARLLMRSLANSNEGGHDKYIPQKFLEEMVAYLTTDPHDSPDDIAQESAHNDVYLDVWVRKFFEAASKGTDLLHCAYNQRDQWSIGSLDGVVLALPIIAAYRHDAEAMLIGRAVEHQMLTHRSITVTMGITIVAPLLQALWAGADPDEALVAAMKKIRPPRVTGREMRESYVAHHGPGNIPKDEKWLQHMAPTNSGETLADVVQELLASGDLPLEDVAGWGVGKARFSSACYVEQALSIVLYLAAKFRDDVKGALSSNALIGGHSTSRGALLGAILGARVGLDKFPRDFVSGLAAPDNVVRDAERVAACAVTYA